MNLTELSEYIPQAITGFILIGLALYRTLKGKLLKNAGTPKGFADLIEVYAVLNEIVSSTNCGRVLVLKTHNCGNSLNPMKDIYSSAIHEVSSKEMPPISNIWDRRKLDKGYIKMLQSLLDASPQPIVIENEDNPSSQLHAVYQNAAVGASLVFLLVTNDSHLYYISCNYTDKTLLTDKDKAFIASKADILKYILNKWN